MRRFLASGVCAALLISAVACSNGDARAVALSQRADAKQPPSARNGDTQGGGSRSGGGGRAGGSGRAAGGAEARTASVVLGASDVYRVARGSVESTLPINGDLRPIETVTVRSRIDGVLQSVAVREGQRVVAGTVLARFESTEQESSLRSAEADHVAALGDFETQKWNLEQSKELFRVGAIAERDLRAAQQAVEASQARLAAAEAKLRSATNVVRDTRVVAPFTGTIEKRRVQNGENTSRGAEMFTLVRSEVLELTATLPARRASEVKIGQPVRFSADNRQFTGTVARVSPTIDPASRSITVYVQIPNSRGELKGNTFATGQIVAKTIDGVLVVPQTAIRTNTDGSGSYVYRIEGGTLAVAPVRLGVLDDARAMVEVTEGLQERDDIVVGTPGTLGRGMKVQIIGSEGRGRGGRGPKSTP